jgi:mannose-1-phosphate guanylyltransferase
VIVRILLLAGGAGTRLWPLSTEDRPKQFLPLLSESSLLAETYARLAPLSGDVFVATSARHAGLVREQVPGVPADRVLAEPARRNSGPAILSAALRFASDGDPVTAAVPCDQTVKDARALRGALEAAARTADRASVVVLAVPPTRPETDFGYIETREDGEGGLAVVRFIEKPDLEKARALAASGRHFWNAGMFVFRPTRLLAEARRVAGPLVAGAERFAASGSADDYEALPSISIDYAVMEKASGVRAVPLEAGWSDVGTWRSVRDLRGASDANGNLLLAPGPVLAPGLRETAVVVGPEGVLVLPFEREGELRAAVEALRSQEASGGRAVEAPGGRR